MNIEDVLRAMRLYAEDDHYGPDVGRWLIAIEAAMREPVGEVGYSWARSTTSQSAAHAYPLALLSDQHIPPGTKLYALPPDAAAEIERLRADAESCRKDAERMRAALEYLFEETGPATCSTSDECFSSGRCGRGAYETPLENAAGGCWFSECSCMSDAQQNAASILDEMDRATNAPVNQSLTTREPKP